MTIWLIDQDLNSHFLRDWIQPSFFVYGSPRELHALCQFIHSAGLPVTMRRAERYELFLRREIELLEVQVRDPARFSLIAQTIRRQNPNLTYYNCTVPISQLYFYERQLFPLARVQVQVGPDDHIRAIELDNDSPWEIDYELPELRTMIIRLEGNGENPNHNARPRPLEIYAEGCTHVLLDDHPRDLLHRIKELFEQYDPDLVITSHGDDYIFPRLLELSRKYGITLPLNRDPQQPIEFNGARSYYSYGRVVFRAASHSLFGRLHLDLDNAFLFDDYSLDGVYEMARLAQMPIQRVARRSTGTCLTSMELSTAYRQNVLIPSVKREAEEFQPADRLVMADNGGLVFRPILGLHEQVAELDFFMMFGDIMNKFNISGETPNCSCCPNSRVPELGFTICQKRRGLVPATIAPVIAKRARLKARIKTLPQGAERERYKRLASCGKWIGVVSFGYTGHHNAVFGNITAHQAICAYARDKLLLAKELAERRGFRMLHAIVDSIYIQKKHAQADEYAELTQAISQATGLWIDIEGIYNWIAFLPSRQDSLLSVANRYFGVFENGEVKVRGLETRRGDTPPFIRSAQNEMIQVLARAKNRAEFGERAREVLELACSYLDRLRSGQVPLPDLAITQRLSHDPNQYTKNTLNAVVAKQLLGDGVELAPGESIQYVILDSKAHAYADRARALEQLDGSAGYDVEKYEALLLRSVVTLLAPIGVTQPMLDKQVAEWRALRPTACPQLPTPQKELPLFAWSIDNARHSTSCRLNTR